MNLAYVDPFMFRYEIYCTNFVLFQHLEDGFGAKKKNAAKARAYGDVWTFIALDADTKLIPSFVVGKRDAYHAKAFMADLAARIDNRVRVSSDSLAAYADAVERGFGSEVDYGTISKTYAPHALPRPHSLNECVQLKV